MSQFETYPFSRLPLFAGTRPRTCRQHEHVITYTRTHMRTHRDRDSHVINKRMTADSAPVCCWHHAPVFIYFWNRAWCMRSNVGKVIPFFPFISAFFFAGVFQQLFLPASSLGQKNALGLHTNSPAAEVSVRSSRSIRTKAVEIRVGNPEWKRQRSTLS